MEHHNQDSMNIWVKLEVDLDPLECETTESVESSNVSNADFNFEGSSASTNFCTDLTYINSHSADYVLPNELVDETEFSKIHIPETQVEICNARILELEKIVNEQKAEIELLRKHQEKCVCRGKRVVKDIVKSPVDINQKINKTGSASKKTQVIKEEIVIPCPVCGYNIGHFRNEYCRIRHIKNCRDRPKFKCSKCNREWTRGDKLKHHIKYECKGVKKKKNRTSTENQTNNL